MRKDQKMQRKERKIVGFASQMAETNDANNCWETERSEKINCVIHFVSQPPEDSKALVRMKFQEN